MACLAGRACPSDMLHAGDYELTSSPACFPYCQKPSSHSGDKLLHDTRAIAGYFRFFNASTCLVGPISPL